MKIAFTGTHGVGKSTIGLPLSKKLKYKFIDNVARNILKNYKDKHKIIISSDEAFQLKVTLEHIKLFRQNKDFVSSRHVIDQLAYSRINGNSQLVLGIIEEYLIEWSSKLTTIYIPIEFPVEDDGCRVMDEDFRKNIDKEIKKIIKEFRIPHLKVTGTIQNRLSQILGGIYDFT